MIFHGKDVIGYLSVMIFHGKGDRKGEMHMDVHFNFDKPGRRIKTALKQKPLFEGSPKGQRAGVCFFGAFLCTQAKKDTRQQAKKGISEPEKNAVNNQLHLLHSHAERGNEKSQAFMRVKRIVSLDSCFRRNDGIFYVIHNKKSNPQQPHHLHHLFMRINQNLFRKSCIRLAFEKFLERGYIFSFREFF